MGFRTDVRTATYDGRHRAARAAKAARSPRLMPPSCRLCRPCRLNIDATPTSTVPTHMARADAVAAAASSPDAALIAAWRSGDEQAADDLVQETFIRAFRAVDRFRNQCQFRTWLLTIGGNVLKDASRRAKRALVVPLDDGLRATDGDPHERTVAVELEARLQQGLEQLPRMQREVFLLRAQQVMEYDDIAAALGTSPGAARVHYHHAVKRLKEHL